MKSLFECFRLAASGALLLTALLAHDSARAAEDVNVVNVPNVSVVNKVDNPVPVGDVTNPAFEPFQVDRRIELEPAEGSASGVLPPAGDEGQRVVIEHVTVDASAPLTQRIFVRIEVGGIQHALVLTSQGIWGGSRRYAASQPIRLYSLGGGAGMGFAVVERSGSAGRASAYVTVSGHLVELP